MSKATTKAKIKAFFKTAFFTYTSTSIAVATDVMDGAAVAASTPLNSLYDQCLIDNGYNNFARIKESPTASGIPGIQNGSTEYTLTLAEPSTFATIFVNNNCKSNDQHRAFGESELWVGNDPSEWSLVNTLVATIYDGGFFNIELAEPAKYVTIRRNGPKDSSLSGGHEYQISEMRVYTHPNLIQTVGASITCDTSSCTEEYQAENLVRHLDNRGCNLNWNPLIATTIETLDYNSCLHSEKSLLIADGHKFVLGFELNLTSFVHKILYVEGHKSWAASRSLVDDSDTYDKTYLHLQNVIWYVGDSHNYVENPQCPGGPQMSKDDDDTYYHDQQTHWSRDN